MPLPTIPALTPTSAALSAAREDMTRLVMIYRMIKAKRKSGAPANPNQQAPAITAEQYDEALGADNLALLDALTAVIEAPAPTLAPAPAPAQN